MLKLFRCVPSLVLAILLAASAAQADTVSGWDFSQWLGSGTLSTNGTSLTNVLPANYSSLDPTQNAGAESAAFGTLYFNGQFGSIAVVPVGDGSEIFTPTAGSLSSNLDAPVAGLGDNPFDSLQILDAENQSFTNLLSMAATGAVQVVFSADLSGVPQSGSGWRVTFGGRATSTSLLAIESSANGTDYVASASVNLTPADTAYDVSLSSASAKQVFVRLRFAPPSGGTQFIDNVAIEAALGTPGDIDGDGFPDATDRCPHFASADQTDTDADGRGNVCECTDQNGDGRNDVADLVGINLAIFNPAQVTPLCDGDNDGACNVNDIVAANVEIFSPTSTSTCARQPVAGP